MKNLSLLLIVVVAGIQLAAVQGLVNSRLPFPFSVAAKLKSVEVDSVDSRLQTPAVPVWPFQWNATLLKIGPDADPANIQWTKFFYDWPALATRFDFYDHYYNLANQWQANFTILFYNTTIYHIYPLERVCKIRSRSIPTISPYWLQNNAKYMATVDFKAVPCNWFQFPADPSLNYYSRIGDNLPMRSTNQAEDPGATDYLDVNFGPSDPNLYIVPSYCPQ